MVLCFIILEQEETALIVSNRPSRPRPQFLSPEPPPLESDSSIDYDEPSSQQSQQSQTQQAMRDNVVCCETIAVLDRLLSNPQPQPANPQQLLPPLPGYYDRYAPTRRRRRYRNRWKDRRRKPPLETVYSKRFTHHDSPLPHPSAYSSGENKNLDRLLNLYRQLQRNQLAGPRPQESYPSLPVQQIMTNYPTAPNYGGGYINSGVTYSDPTSALGNSGVTYSQRPRPAVSYGNRIPHTASNGNAMPAQDIDDYDYDDGAGDYEDPTGDDHDILVVNNIL